jgi:hypothetical protein
MNEVIAQGKRLNFLPTTPKSGDLVPLEGRLRSTATKESDELDALMDKIDTSKNRKERRRLLAEFNKKQELVWGQASSIAKLSQKSADKGPPVEDLKNKVYNRAT